MAAGIGPALGSYLGGQSLTIYTYPSVEHLLPNNIEWVGAWWLCHLIIGSLCTVLAFLVMLFPTHLKNYERYSLQRESSRNTTIGRQNKSAMQNQASGLILCHYDEGNIHIHKLALTF